MAKKALQFTPKWGEAWHLLAEAHYAAGDFEAAVSSMQKSYEFYGDYKPYSAKLQLALALAHSGQRDKGREIYQAAIAAFDKSPNEYWFGHTYRRLRQEADRLFAASNDEERETEPDSNDQENRK